MAALTALLGSLRGISYERHPTTTTPAMRQAARRKLERLRRRRHTLDEDRALVTDANTYRHRLYRRESFYEIEIARGDTWEEIIAQVEALLLKEAGRG